MARNIEIRARIASVEAAGVREAGELMAALGVDPAQLIEGAYVDLLAAVT